MLAIGNLKLKSPFILAPMAGVSTYPFRKLNRQFGCELAFVEMISSRSLSSRNRKTLEMLKNNPDDKPLGVQILGDEEEYILKSIGIVSEYNFDLLDFNAACPTKKVTSRGKGASLLKTPGKLNKLLKSAVKNSKVPVTVKVRIGWDNDEDSEDIARYCEDAGVKAIFVHGRTRQQGYSGKVNYGAIRKMKGAVSIPVIGSGDVFSALLAKKMFDETKCDAIVIARGALGNPWIFKELKEFFKSGEIPEKPSPLEIAETMKEDFNEHLGFFGERSGIKRFRKFFIWYTHGFHKIKAIRNKVCKARTSQEIYGLMDEFKNTAKVRKG